MSRGPNSPPPLQTAIADDHDDRDILESLSGLSIKGFQDCLPSASIMHTPSSTNVSLPTPPALKSSIAILVTPAQSSAGDGWCPLEPTIQTLGAPFLKDLDSFTEGTNQGSFSFLAPAGNDDRMLFYHHHDDSEMTSDKDSSSIPASNSLALELLPPTGDLEEVVQAWRQNIEPTPLPQDTPVAKKRRRSITQNGDYTDERRTRVWSPTTDSAPHVSCFALDEGYSLEGRTDHDAPD